jgi:hypothetical protein
MSVRARDVSPSPDGNASFNARDAQSPQLGQASDMDEQARLLH